MFWQWSVVDSLGQMKQTSMPTNPQAPADTSPPSSGFAQSHASSSEVHMSTMDDIDWNEWESVFPSSVYTGELDIPNYNMNDWHGTSSNGPHLDASIFNPSIAAAGIGGGGMNAYSDQLADVQLSPTLIPDQSQWRKTSYQRYPPQFG